MSACRLGVHMCLCVYLSERERERERECVHAWMYSLCGTNMYMYEQLTPNYIPQVNPANTYLHPYQPK